MTFRFSIPFLTIQSKAPTVERNKLCRLEILFVFVFSLPQLFSSLTYAFAQATTYTARDAGAPNIGGGSGVNAPNSDAARDLFLAAIDAAPTVEDFENAVTGNYANFAGNGYNIDFGANNSVTQDSIIDNAGGASNATGGFNTTTGGDTRLRSNTGADTGQPVIITFTFDVPQTFLVPTSAMCGNNANMQQWYYDWIDREDYIISFNAFLTSAGIA